MNMTQEDKQLLLIDLCARLPYGVKTSNGYGTLKLSPRTDVTYVVDNEHISYLRPMSSMTEKETLEFVKTTIKTPDGYPMWTTDSYDWLNKYHFDYRGLIPMSLALEAKEGMYRL